MILSITRSFPKTVFECITPVIKHECGYIIETFFLAESAGHSGTIILLVGNS